ncbi:Thiamine-monophosphate kinase [Austwickia sp. TVS 96-490-7B]|nr:thiamine-phosphate kinase [Austwickia sp. TVS 96-490-7B]MBW3085789.1 Thiamine-monophosphate kinase [Austwickia sp. TVS 96-490-7B]
MLPADAARTDRPTRLRDLSEEELLSVIMPVMRYDDERMVVGPGDDAAVMGLSEGRVVITTDAMVRGVDWRDDWSSGIDVGRKVIAQNLGDVAAMGAVPAGVVVTLLADPDTTVEWVVDVSTGIAAAAAAAGCPVLGGDLGCAGQGAVVVSVTALGDLQGRRAVLRSGARPGDVVAVSGSLGRSGAGLTLLTEGVSSPLTGRWAGVARELIETHRAPVTPVHAGPCAAVAGARAMIDISDGLVRDAGRVAAASGVCLSLNSAALTTDVDLIAGVLGVDTAWEMVLGGGEEHSLLAIFPAEVSLPGDFRCIGAVSPGAGVQLDGAPCVMRGWDHFAG